MLIEIAAEELRRQSPILFDALLFERQVMIDGGTEREAIDIANSFLAEHGHDPLPDIA